MDQIILTEKEITDYTLEELVELFNGFDKRDVMQQGSGRMFNKPYTTTLTPVHHTHNEVRSSFASVQRGLLAKLNLSLVHEFACKERNFFSILNEVFLEIPTHPFEDIVMESIKRILVSCDKRIAFLLYVTLFFDGKSGFSTAESNFSAAIKFDIKIKQMEIGSFAGELADNSQAETQCPFPNFSRIYVNVLLKFYNQVYINTPGKENYELSGLSTKLTSFLGELFSQQE